MSDSITLSFNVQYGTTTGSPIYGDALYNNSPSLSFGFLNSSSDIAYAMVDVSSIGHPGQGVGSRFFERANSVNIADAGTPLESFWTAPGNYFQTSTPYNFTFTVEKNANGATPYTISYFLDGNLIHSLNTALSLDAQAITDIGFRSYPVWNGGSIYVTDIMASISAIPEPSTYLLLALGIGTIGLLRRRVWVRG
jgi:hypothetical protein